MVYEDFKTYLRFHLSTYSFGHTKLDPDLPSFLTVPCSRSTDLPIVNMTESHSSFTDKTVAKGTDAVGMKENN